MTMRIVLLNGRPFAYAQDYEAHTWPQPHLAHLPQGSRAIDSFIGWPSMIGRGHGQAYLRLLAARLCAEAASGHSDNAKIRVTAEVFMAFERKFRQEGCRG